VISGVTGLVISMTILPCSASPYSLTTGTALAYGTARMTDVPGRGGAGRADSGAAERVGQFLGFDRVAADDLDGVAASERPVGQGAGHVPQAD